jgi:hypothetical protein
MIHNNFFLNTRKKNYLFYKYCLQKQEKQQNRQKQQEEKNKIKKITFNRYFFQLLFHAIYFL